MLEAPILAGPHLVLTHARADDRVVRGVVAQRLEHELGLQGATGLRLVVVQRVLLLPAADGRAPPAAIGEAAPAVEQGADRGGQTADDVLAVPDDRDVGAPVLSELGRVDVGVDDLGIGREFVELAGDSVVEAGAEGDQQIGLLERGDRRVVAVHARHAERQWVAVRERAPRHEGRDHVDVAQLGQLAQFLCRVRLEDPAACVDDGSRSGQDQLGGLADLAGMALGRRLVAGEAGGDLLVGRPVPVERAAGVAGVDDVLGDVDQHRPGATGRGDVERLAHDAGDVGCLGHEPVVLGDRHGDAGRIALLERVGADGGCRDLAGDAHHRDRVEVGVGQRRDYVGGSGAARDHADAGPARHVGVALGHVAGALFVADEHVTDGALDDRVVDGQDRTAGQPEDDLDALQLEGLDEGLSPVHGAIARHCSLSFDVWDLGLGRVRRRSKTTTTSLSGGRERTQMSGRALVREYYERVTSTHRDNTLAPASHNGDPVRDLRRPSAPVARSRACGTDPTDPGPPRDPTPDRSRTSRCRTGW